MNHGCEFEEFVEFDDLHHEGMYGFGFGPADNDFQEKPSELSNLQK